MFSEGPVRRTVHRQLRVHPRQRGGGLTALFRDL